MSGGINHTKRQPVLAMAVNQMRIPNVAMIETPDRRRDCRGGGVRYSAHRLYDLCSAWAART